MMVFYLITCQQFVLFFSANIWLTLVRFSKNYKRQWNTISQDTRYPMFTNIRNMWIKKYHTMSRWRNAYVIGNHQVTLYHFVSLRFTFTEFKTFSILRFRSCFLRATWSVSCTLLLMMKNYNNLFQQTTITHTKKTSIARIYIKNVSRF